MEILLKIEDAYDDNGERCTSTLSSVGILLPEYQPSIYARCDLYRLCFLLLRSIRKIHKMESSCDWGISCRNWISSFFDVFQNQALAYHYLMRVLLW